MFHDIELHHKGKHVGNLQVLSEVRLPADEHCMEQFTAMVFMMMRTKSFLYQVRQEHWKLELHPDKITIVFVDTVRPVEIGMLVGFTNIDPAYACDEEDIKLSQNVVGDKREFGPDVSALDPLGSLLAAMGGMNGKGDRIIRNPFHSSSRNPFGSSHAMDLDEEYFDEDDGVYYPNHRGDIE